MDLLLSLPIASYFFTSGLTSWSTSLNLLFFYLTWSTLILSHSPLRIELAGVFFLKLLFALLPSLLFLSFDTFLPSLAESLKHGGRSALPPRDVKVIAKMVLLALGNLTASVAIEGCASWATGWILGSPVFRTSTALPLPWQMVKHVALLFVARELLTYYIHRYVLHSTSTTISTSSSSSASRSTFLSRFKLGRDNTPSAAILHAEYAHGRSAPAFALLAMADHPWPFLLHRSLPTFLPALVLSLLPSGWPWTWVWSLPLPFLHTQTNSLFFGRSSSSSWFGSSPSWFGTSKPLFPVPLATPKLHLLTYFVFLGLSTLEETLTHSGYSVVPGIVMGGMTRRTATHYSAPGEGNFGCLGVTDWVCGTSVGGDVVQDLGREAEKHQLRERGEEKMGEVEGVVRNGVNGLRRSGRRKGRGGEGSESEGK